jgi:hypothetical protein
MKVALYLMGAWQCATLAWGDPKLPSPLMRFTSEFGMGSGGAASLLSPDKNYRVDLSVFLDNIYATRTKLLPYGIRCHRYINM